MDASGGKPDMEICVRHIAETLFLKIIEKFVPRPQSKKIYGRVASIINHYWPLTENIHHYFNELSLQQAKIK